MRSEEIKPKRYILSALTRRASDNDDRLVLTSYTIPDLLANTAPPRTPYDIIDLILVAIHDGTRSPLGYVGIKYDDYPLFFVRNVNELTEFLRLLQRLDLIEYRDSPDEKEFVVRLTLKGWDGIAERRKKGMASGQAFVAMSFAPELDTAYDEAIFTALTDAGWTPVRMDRTHHNERIDDRIVAEIKRSGMVIADFTGNRPGVYFEAGLALGLGIPVIWTVKESDLEDVHFDTRQYNHIVWKQPDDFREQLYNRVVATVRPPAP